MDWLESRVKYDKNGTITYNVIYLDAHGRETEDAFPTAREANESFPGAFDEDEDEN